MNICLNSTLSNLGGYSVRVQGFAKLHVFVFVFFSVEKVWVGWTLRRKCLRTCTV
jgi:hypothetical protein